MLGDMQWGEPSANNSRSGLCNRMGTLKGKRNRQKLNVDSDPKPEPEPELEPAAKRPKRAGRKSKSGSEVQPEPAAKHPKSAGRKSKSKPKSKRELELQPEPEHEEEEEEDEELDEIGDGGQVCDAACASSPAPHPLQCAVHNFFLFFGLSDIRRLFVVNCLFMVVQCGHETAKQHYACIAVSWCVILLVLTKPSIGKFWAYMPKHTNLLVWTILSADRCKWL